MEFDLSLEKCGDDDVIQLPNAIYKIGHLKNALDYALRNQNKVPHTLFHGLHEKGIKLADIPTTQKILMNGIDAEILKVGAKGWQKGTFRINVTVEFIPDEPESSQPESPLDDLREMLKVDSQ